MERNRKQDNLYSVDNWICTNNRFILFNIKNKAQKTKEERQIITKDYATVRKVLQSQIFI